MLSAVKKFFGVPDHVHKELKRNAELTREIQNKLSSAGTEARICPFAANCDRRLSMIKEQELSRAKN